MRTRRYKYIRNLFPELEFPHASDLWASATWQSMLKQGPSAKLGGRPVSSFLRRPAEELYDIVKDPDELVNLAPSLPHHQTLVEMRNKVHRWRRETKDPWMILSNYAKDEFGGTGD
jgi:N-sulfoglucosamine sulfohydrolase